MLSLSVVEKIAVHLQAGVMSQREIARKVGVGRATVSAIANGRRGLYGRSVELQPPEPEPLDPAARCPHCGYLVHLPCLVCRTREYRQGRRSLAALGRGCSDIARHTARRSGRRRRTRLTRVA